MAEILRGAPAAAALTGALNTRCAALRAAGITPTLAILRVGERGGDLAYENAAVKRCGTVGIDVRRVALPTDCGSARLLAAIDEINADDSVHGCLMLRPLPDREAEAQACARLAPEKDMDGMTPGSLAAVYAGTGAGYPPCTAEAVMVLLRHYGTAIAGKRAVVLGRSLVIGRPAAMLLLREDATVTLCHTGTADPAALCREADILVAAAGRAGVVDAGFLSPGQTVVDVGINVGPDGSICGDVDFDAASSVAAAVTPVPGGVGSVTTAVLAKHVIEAAEKAARL